MRTTLNIPDELYRDVRVRAASEGRTVTSLVEQALRSLLADHRQDAEPFVLRALPARTGHENFPPLPFDPDDNSAVLDYIDAVDGHSGAEQEN